MIEAITQWLRPLDMIQTNIELIKELAASILFFGGKKKLVKKQQRRQDGIKAGKDANMPQAVPDLAPVSNNIISQLADRLLKQRRGRR